MRFSSLAGIFAAVLGCTSQPEVQAPATARGQREQQDGLDVVELDAMEAQRRMSAGTLSSRALTRTYLQRIAAIDDAGPRLSAVIEVNPEAEAEAEARDSERAAGRVRGPLHGIPVLIKDNIAVVGMANSAGTLALAQHRPRADAFLVTRLREAGAVILGKTNLSEWANFRGEKSVSGWSSRGGQTRNPYVLDRSPCGSSSGAGAAIAASLATVGVGTETDGSILCPSAVNGLVGLKPTVGLISRTGIVPISASQDTAGPMTRTVTEAALLLMAMVGEDARDPAMKRGPVMDYTGALVDGALRGKRIGALKYPRGRSAAVDAAFDKAVATLRAGGAVVVEAEISSEGDYGEYELEVLLYEFKDGMARFFEETGAPVGSLAGLIAWNKEHADEVMRWFGQEVFEKALAKGGLDSPEYLKAKAEARRLAWDEGLGAVLIKNKLDAVIVPTMTGPAWPIDPVLGDRYVGAGYSAAAVAGTPSLTVPMGEEHGLPLGLAFMGAPYSEATLLAIGHAFEQATHARKPPTYLPTL